MDVARSLTLYGTTQPVASARQLRAGALRCEFVDGALRDIRWSGVEIVRGIAYLLRDLDWGTVPAECSALVVNESDTCFALRFTLRMKTPAGALDAHAHIEGDANGRLSFEVRATPDAAIETNRCGFVVLHPAAAAGRALRVEHTDGRTSDARFPLEINPAQPVLDIRALAYAPSNATELRLRFDAELPHDPAGKFEMEDQRNWSDASFKTYAASLLDRWPYVLPANIALTQCVGLRVSGTTVPAAPREAVAVTIGATTDVRMPAAGVGVPPGFANAGMHEKAALADLGARLWIVEIALDDPRYHADLSAIAAARRRLDVRVRLDVILPDSWSPDAGARVVAYSCAATRLRVDAVRMLPRAYLKSFQPSDRWPDLPPLEAYARAARARFPNAQIGGGMFTCFTELNRKRQSADGLDFIGHATFPVVHAADDRSVMQTTESLAHIVQSVRRLWPDLAYHLGPSTIAMRRNPYGDLPAENPLRHRLALAVVDPRHSSQFGAAWTAAYVAAVAPLGVEMLALHESHGASGPFGSQWPDKASSDTVVAPTWALWGRFAAASGSAIVELENLPELVAGVAWRTGDRGVFGVVANLGEERRRIRWTAPVRSDGLGATTQWLLDSFETRPFELCREVPTRQQAIVPRP